MRTFAPIYWLLATAVTLLVQGCVSPPESGEDKASESVPFDAGQAAWLDDPMLDGVFVVPGVDFSAYQSLLVPELNLDQWHPVGQELPLEELNRNDRRFFQQTYSQTLVHTLVMNGDYALAMDPEDGVLEVRANLRQSVQPLGETDPQNRPRGTIVMLLTLDLHDAKSGDLVATMTSRQPIDRSMNERNSPLTAMQVRRAFLEWMRWFREELDSLRT